MNRFIRNILLELWLPCLIVCVWWLVSHDSQAMQFPPLSIILQRFGDEWFFARFWSDLIPSLRNFSLGLLIGVVTGVVAGTALGLSSLARHALPLLEVMRAIPVIALIPLIVMILGTGDIEKIAIIAFGAVWPILLNTVDGIAAIDPTQREVGRSFAMDKRDVLFFVILPAASPQITAGLRLSVSIALVATVGSELFASTGGIGYVILSATQGWDMPQMWAALLMLAAVGYALNGLMTVFDRRALKWHWCRAASNRSSSR